MRRILGVYGASGFGREVMPLCREFFASKVDEFLFVDDGDCSTTQNGHAVLSFDGFYSCEADEKSVVIAIADSAIRQRLHKRCEEAGFQLPSLLAHQSLVLDQAEIASSAVVCPFSTISSNVSIGVGLHANFYSYVAHDCVLGDFVTLAPSAKVLGNVMIEDHSYIGAGAVIRQGVPGDPLVIGKGAVVGMGAVVTKSVAAGTTVVGCPAKPLLGKLGRALNAQGY